MPAAQSSARQSSGIRVLGAAVEPITSAGGHSRNSALFAELERHFAVAGTLRPELPPLEAAAIRLRWFAAGAEARPARAAVNPWTFARRSAALRRALARRSPDFDVLLVLQTLFGAPAATPTVVYTDSTAALTAREYPVWLPLGTRALARQLELEAAACRDARAVLTMSEWARRSIIEDYGCAPERVVRAGAGTNLVARSLDDRGWDRPVALFVGYEFERKGGPEVLAAFRHVRAELPEAELWIVGPPRPQAPPQPGVTWRGTLSDRREVAAAYAAAAAFVLPSRFDPSAHVLREAMGSGLPCVATPTGATAEIVEDGRTGVLVAPGDPGALAAALAGLLGDPARAERLGRAGHAAVLEHHTWAAVVARMAPVIAAAAA